MDKHITLIFFLLAVSLSSYKTEEIENCEPFGARTLMGDYFLLEDKKQPVMTIAVNTADKCEDLFLEYYKYKHNTINIVKSSYIKTIDGNNYLQEESTYLIYSHFFHVKHLDEGKRYFYKFSNQ